MACTTAIQVGSVTWNQMDQTGVPRVYELRPGFSVQSWRYLGDPAEVERRAAAVKAQAGSKSTSG